MSQLILSRGIDYRGSLLKRFMPNFHPGPGFLIASLIIFVALFTVITLMFSARQVTKGYVLNSLEAQHQEAIKENEQMDMELSKVRSLNHIQELPQVDAMVKPDQIVYFNSEVAIAKR
jgi:hypothetical protein